MYELVRAGARSYYLQSPAKVGIYLQNETDVYLIDSGNDKDAGRRIRKVLDENGWALRAILNTHSNADHIGGNRYLQQQCGCKIFAGGVEAAFTRAPMLEPAFLYGGYPFKELRHKFLMAAASDTAEFSGDGFPGEIEVIPLPGHFFEMVGFRLPDDTVFLADCLSSAETLEKYQIPFIYDVDAYLKTLDKVASLQAKLFVPSHAEAARDIRPLAELNRQKVQEIAAHILARCETPQSFETLLEKLFDDYRLAMTYEQYVLVGSTIRSYLSWLKDNERIVGYIENNRLLWKAKD